MVDHAGSRQPRGGPIKWALQPLLALVVACSSTGAAVTTTNPTSPSTSTTTTTTTLATTTATQAIDVGTVFGEALAATSPNYAFQSVVTVGEQTVTTIQGIVDGVSVAASIMAGTSEVAYVRTPEGEWVTGPDDEWSVLEGEAPAGAPLAGLADVTDLALESADSEMIVILATLGPAAGPAAGTRVSITVSGGLITVIRYQAQSGADTAEVTTTVTGVGSAGAVEAPAV
ncbi:MAG TPA: hypothetical protein VJA46_11685 [Acidimicrobiia bacterium]|nr:hypothetical protein [Acidimicrobiia bacterium]